METTNQENFRSVLETYEAEISQALVRAIKNGAKIEKRPLSGGVMIDDIYIISPQISHKDKASIVLDVDAPEIRALFEPTKEDLEKRAEEMRAELKKIENQLKEA